MPETHNQPEEIASIPQDLIVPKEIVASQTLFQKWFLDTYRHLYGGDGTDIDAEIKVSYDAMTLPATIEGMQIYLQDVLRIANMIFHRKLDYPDFLLPHSRDTIHHKKGKRIGASTELGDLLAISCAAIVTHHKITYTRLGEALGISHCSVVYYLKRHKNMMSYDKIYKIAYLKFLTALKNERLIPPIKIEKRNTKWLLHPILPGPESKL
jgi:hypothetical protein